jgi:deazaflavin-dependent oxidoreductase (nitroreductase family)
MVDFRNIPKPMWRLMKFPKVLFRFGFGPRFVLLLTTIGRKTGLHRVTPLQYEEQNDIIYVASARGSRADWYRNLAANPNVLVQIKSLRFRGQAYPINDPTQIADFLNLRLRNHPRMVSAMFKAEGLSTNPTRVELEKFADKIALVAIKRRYKLPQER